MDPEELQISLKKSLGIEWDPSRVGDIFAKQAVFIGIYDGCVSLLDKDTSFNSKFSHGGPAVSGFLRQELHGLFESVDP